MHYDIFKDLRQRTRLAALASKCIKPILLIGPAFSGKTTSLQFIRDFHKTGIDYSHLEIKNKHLDKNECQNIKKKILDKESVIIETTPYTISYILEEGWKDFEKIDNNMESLIEKFQNRLRAKRYDGVDNELPKYFLDNALKDKIVEHKLGDNDVNELYEHHIKTKFPNKVKSFMLYKEKIIELSSVRFSRLHADKIVILDILLEKIEEYKDSLDKIEDHLKEEKDRVDEIVGALGLSMIDGIASSKWRLAPPILHCVAAVFPMVRMDNTNIMQVPEMFLLGMASLLAFFTEKRDSGFAMFMRTYKTWNELDDRKKRVICDRLDEKYLLPPRSSYDFLSNWLGRDAKSFEKRIESLFTDEFVLKIKSILEEFPEMKQVVNEHSKKLYALEKITAEQKIVLEKHSRQIDSLSKAKRDTYVIGKAEDIRPFLSVRNPSDLDYVTRAEDNLLTKMTCMNDIIIMTGLPGAGKSTLLSRLVSSQNFLHYVLIKSLFADESISHLKEELKEKEIDDFAIIWDNIHNTIQIRQGKNLAERLVEELSLSGKKFKLFGTHRENVKYDFGNARTGYLPLKDFRDPKLVDDCINKYKVELAGITPADILKKSDGTPYYVISFFEQFKGKKITRKDIETLPKSTIELWRMYIKRLEDDGHLDYNEMNAFRSVAFFSHIFLPIDKSRLFEVYTHVFRGDKAGLDYALHGILEKSLISYYSDEYYMHSSHAEALETIYPIEHDHIQRSLDTLSFSEMRRLGNWVFHTRKFQWANSIFDKILEIDPKYVGALNGKGCALVCLGKHDEAITLYDKALEINPKYFAVLHNKGLTLYNLGKHDEAIKLYDKALEIDPKNVGALNGKGLALYKLGKPEEAITLYDKALEVDPKYLAALDNKGFALDNLGKPEEAITLYDKALEIDPKDVAALDNKGFALYNLGKPEEAITLYDKALEIDPKYAYALYNKGLALDNLGKHVDAITWYDKALEINPKDVITLNKKGLALYNLGKLDEAIISFDKALEINPNDVVALKGKRSCT